MPFPLAACFNSASSVSCPNRRQHMAKRQKRAAISRSSRKKPSAGETPHHCKTADDLPNIVLLQNGEQLGSGGQSPNVVRLPSAGRLLGVQVLLNADRRGNAVHGPPQSRRSRKRCRAGRHHRKTRSQLTKLSSVRYRLPLVERSSS
jgi:hypothetical protein